MGKAWDDAVSLIGSNFGLLATILGLFYFLPTFAVALFFPELNNPEMAAAPPGADPDVALEAMMAGFQEIYARSWPFLLVTTLLQYVGAICVFALFPIEGNPTVGEALQKGLRGAPSYLATQLIVAIGAAIVFGIPIGIAFAISPVVGALLILPLVIAIIYVTIKLTLVPAVIGVEGELNPVTAIKRGWALTKGNSLRIFFFLVVLFLVAGLITIVVTGALTVVLAMAGGTAANIGIGFISSLSNAAIGGLFLVVIAAIHRQLSGHGTPSETETFE